MYNVYGGSDIPRVTCSNQYVFVDNVRILPIQRFIHNYYDSASFANKFLNINWYGKAMSFHRFFVPEVIYIFQEALKNRFGGNNYQELVNQLIMNTWYKDTQIRQDTKVDMNVVMSLKRKPLPHQLEFIKDIYSQKKEAFKLKGYLLAFGMGLGKSTTSVLLAEGLHKKHIIIVAPKSVTKNVWPTEIEETVGSTTIWTTDQNLNLITEDTKYIVVNYESVDKIFPYVKKFDSASSMIIVDECHYCKDIKSKRCTDLVELADILKCTDILLMSGTPVKALSIECMPIFRLLDTFYDNEVEEQLRIYARYPKIINELLHNRLGLMMLRKLKEDVLELPKKIESELKIKIKDGDEYTLTNVRNKLSEYRNQRTAYYDREYKRYEKEYFDILDYFENNCIYSDAELKVFKQYMKDAKYIHTSCKVSFMSMEMSKFIQAVNKYEKEVICERLPNDMKKRFRDCKTVYKYVQLKIMGEVLGNELNRLRVEMTSKIINSEVINIIRSAKKKTILFSSYTDSIKIANDVCKKNGLKPMVIDGTNSNEAKKLVAIFKEKDEYNPLIASIKVMSTGHTINEANTVIFLNVPFRSTDYEQASERCYRIGQDTDVYIYKLVLDTGDEPNLSTRMQDILSWSKDQFGQIVDGEETIPEVALSFIQKLDNPTEDVLTFFKDTIKKFKF